MLEIKVLGSGCPNCKRLEAKTRAGGLRRSQIKAGPYPSGWRKSEHSGMIFLITPFCLCSAVSLFIGFVESGMALGHVRLENRPAVHGVWNYGRGYVPDDFLADVNDHPAHGTTPI